MPTSLGSLTSSDPATFRKAEQQALTELQALASDAPSQIKAAVQTVAAAEQSLFTALKTANLDDTKINPAALSSLENPAFVSATKTVTTFLASSCGITEPSTAASPDPLVARSLARLDKHHPDCLR